MTAKEATAEVFWKAFKAQAKPEQAAIVARLLGAKESVEGLADVVLIEHARCDFGSDTTVWSVGARDTICPSVCGRAGARQLSM